MSSHIENDNDNDHHHDTSKTVSDLELGVIKGGGEENDNDNDSDNIKKNYQSNSLTEIKHSDRPNTNDVTKQKQQQQQQGSTSVTCQLIPESNGPILEVMESRQQHPNKSSPPMSQTKVESVNKSTQDNDETDRNNAQNIIRPGAERVYPTGVSPPTTRIDNYTTDINPPGTSSRITSEQQEQEEPLEIVATLVTDDSRRMSRPNTNNGPLIIAVAEEKKCCEIRMDCSKCSKTMTFVGLMLAIALIVVAVVVLKNKPGGGDDDDGPPNLIDNDTTITTLSPLPTMTPTISPTATTSPTVSPTPAPGQIVPLGDPIYGQSSNYHAGYAISLSDNGQRIAIGSLFSLSGSASGMVQVYERMTNDVWTPMGSPVMQTQMDYSLKGLISLSANGNVLAIDAHDPTVPFTVTYRYVNGDWQPMGQRQMKARAVSLSSDGMHLAIADENYHAHVFSFDEDDNDWVLKGSVVEGRSVMVSLSGDGKRLVVSDYDKDNFRGEVKVFELTMMTTVDGDNGTLSNMTIVDDNDGSNMTDSNTTEAITEGLQALGDTIMGTDSNNFLGWEISTSHDGSIVAVGTRAGNYVRIIQYNPSINSWITIDTIHGTAMDSNTFGFSVSLSGSGRRLAIGVMSYNDGTGRGAVYEWDERMKSYEQVGDDIIGDEVQQYETNGISISRDGAYVATGAPYVNNRQGVTKTGRVRVFKIW